MPIVHSTDENTTTAVIDVGADTPIVVFIGAPIEAVKMDLKDGYAYGDSGFGEVHFPQSSVKCLFKGKQELNALAHNRPSP